MFWLWFTDKNIIAFKDDRLSLKREIEFIVEDNEYKVGKYLPKLGIYIIFQ